MLKFLLFFRVHHVLSALGLSHFLCYGSLWGQIRISRSLPWEADVEFCLLNEELAKNDEVFLVRTFKKHNLQLTYNSGEGLYFVNDPVLTGSSIQLIVFEEDPMVKYYSCSSLNAITLKQRVCDLLYKIFFNFVLFWNMTQCILVERFICLGGMCCLRLQGSRVHNAGESSTSYTYKEGSTCGTTNEIAGISCP